MKKRLFPLIIALSALSVAGSAAFYSVFGLSKLFAGAATQVIVMAASLEFAKLVVASLLYQYWGTINKILKGYLMIACFVLMVITSGGIYGFLSGAYQETATQSELLDKSLVILEHKQERFNETKEDLVLEKTQLNQSIADLRVSLSNPHSVSWFDKNSQTVITSSSGSARRALQAELKTAIFDRDNLNLKLEAVLDSIGNTDMALLNKEISNENERELGPLKYLAKTTGKDMDQVVNWFLLLIIFVFDPLAIALVVAANMAFAQIRKPKVKMAVPEGLEFNKPYPMHSSSEPNESLIKRVKENQEKLKEDLTYPQFVEKHYAEPEINTYGDDDWATPQDEDNLFTDLESQIPVTDLVEEPKETIEPTFEDIKPQRSSIKIDELYWEREENEKPMVESADPINPSEEDLGKLQTYLDNLSKPPLDRLTDTTQTLIVEKDEPTSTTTEENKENIKNRMEEENAQRILRYRKRKE